MLVSERSRSRLRALHGNRRTQAYSANGTAVTRMPITFSPVLIFNIVLCVADWDTRAARVKKKVLRVKARGVLPTAYLSKHVLSWEGGGGKGTPSCPDYGAGVAHPVLGVWILGYPQEGTWDQWNYYEMEMGYPLERSWDQWKYYGMEMGHPLLTDRHLWKHNLPSYASGK